MGYEQAIARRNELQGTTGASYAPGAAGASGTTAGLASGQAQLFQQQLTAATMDSMAAADSGQPAPTTGASNDPYAALQGGGLSTQAGLMAQMQGMVAQNQGAAASTGTAGGFTVDQLQSMLAQAQGQGAVTAAPTAPIAPTNVTGKTANLDPELLGRLDQLGAQLGQKIDVISGNRTTEEQAVLYQRYLNGTGNLAAPPGKSNHEHGAAVDAYVNGVALANVPGARDAAAKLGLHFPVGGEAWHVERIDR